MTRRWYLSTIFLYSIVHWWCLLDVACYFFWWWWWSDRCRLLANKVVKSSITTACVAWLWFDLFIVETSKRQREREREKEKDVLIWHSTIGHLVIALVSILLVDPNVQPVWECAITICNLNISGNNDRLLHQCEHVKMSNDDHLNDYTRLTMETLLYYFWIKKIISPNADQVAIR